MNDSEWLRRIHTDTQAMKKDTAKVVFATRMMFLLLLACTIKYLAHLNFEWVTEPGV